MKKGIGLIALLLAAAVCLAGCGGLSKEASFDGLRFKVSPDWVELTSDANALGGNSVTYVGKGQDDRIAAFGATGAIVISAMEMPDNAIELYGETQTVEDIAGLMGVGSEEFVAVNPPPEGANHAWSWSGEFGGIPANVELLQGGGRAYLTMCGGEGELAKAWPEFVKTFSISAD